MYIVLIFHETSGIFRYATQTAKDLNTTIKFGPLKDEWKIIYPISRDILKRLKGRKLDKVIKCVLITPPQYHMTLTKHVQIYT